MAMAAAINARNKKKMASSGGSGEDLFGSDLSSSHIHRSGGGGARMSTKRNTGLTVNVEGKDFENYSMKGTKRMSSITMDQRRSETNSSEKRPSMPIGGLRSPRRRSTTLTLEGGETIIYDDESSEAANITLRDKLYYLFEGFPGINYAALFPNWWTAADIVGKGNFLLVILSCMAFAVETLPQYYERDLLSFFIIETICIACFTIDIIVRFVTCRNKLKFCRSLMNWIDFVSIIPYYISFADFGNQASGLLMLRVLRLARIFRVLKLSKHNVGLEAVVEALAESSEAISLLGFLLLIALILFSSAMFFAEQTGQTFDEDDREWRREGELKSPFQSIFHTMWWCLVTMTTVGYGDHYPITALGKIVGGITMLCGVFVLAFPTVILSTNFQEIHQSKVDAQRQLDEQLAEQKKLAQKRRELEEEKKRESQRSSAAGTQLNTPSEASEVGKGTDGASSPPRTTMIVIDNEGTVDEKKIGAEKSPTNDQSTDTTATTTDASTAWKKGGAPPIDTDGQSIPSDSKQTSNHVSPKAAMEEDIAEKPVCFTYTYSPYMSTTDEKNTTLAPRVVNNVPIADLMANQKNAVEVAKNDVEEEDEGVEVREVIILDDYNAVYNSVLHFQTTDDNRLDVKAEAHGNKTIVTLHLVLESEDCQHAAESALHDIRPDLEDRCTLVPRPISKLRVDISCDHPLLQGVRLLTNTFRHPAGCVPLSIFVPIPSLVTTLLTNISCIQLNVSATYDTPAVIDEPLIHYGGLVLGGTSFEDCEEEVHQKALVDECRDLEQRQQQKTTIGQNGLANRSVGGAGGSKGSAFGTTKTTQGAASPLPFQHQIPPALVRESSQLSAGTILDVKSRDVSQNVESQDGVGSSSIAGSSSETPLGIGGGGGGGHTNGPLSTDDDDLPSESAPAPPAAPSM